MFFILLFFKLEDKTKSKTKEEKKKNIIVLSVDGILVCLNRATIIINAVQKS